MKILLIGASGMIGSRVQAEAVSRGHFVLGVARHPEKIATGDHVWAARGDATDGDALAALAAGADVIVGSVSPRNGGDPMVEATSYAKAVIAAAKASGKRLFIVGGAGSLTLPDGTPLASVLPPDMLEPRAMIEARKLIEAAGIDWTYFCPALMIEPGERTTHYRLGTTELINDAEGNSKISAEDYAHALVDELETPRHRNSLMSIGY